MSQFHFTESEAFTIADEPWKTVENLIDRIATLVNQLGDDYVITDGVAIHKTATIAHNVTIKPPAIISEQCFVGANSYLRGGVFLAPRAKVGIGCEIKTSIILEDSAVAHFNFVGDSILGKNVNIEAGAILANHYNERDEKNVFVHINGKRISTNLQKLGSFVGDGCRIGANAVLSPGTILLPNTIVKRLELVEQDK